MGQVSDLAQRFIDARNARDRAALLEVFAPTASCSWAAATSSGTPVWRNWLERMTFGAMMRIDVNALVRERRHGGRVCTETYVWVEDGSPAGEPVDGAVLIKTQEDRVTRFWPSNDIAAVFAAAQITPLSP